MGSLDYSFRNKELVFFSFCLIVHFSAAFFYKVLEINELSIYNFVISVFYVIFIFVKNIKYANIKLGIAFIEIMIYSIFLTYILGNDAGMLQLLVCMHPFLFLYTRNSSQSLRAYFILAPIAIICTVIMLYLDFGFFFSDYESYFEAIRRHPRFFRIHESLITCVIAFFLIYLNFISREENERAHIRLRVQLEMMEQRANHDQLTGLMNRRAISKIFNNLQNRKLSEKKDYAFCIFDIDNFKSFNDTYGHDAGDFVLSEVSNFVKASIKENEHIARWGGEEFVILFEKYDSSIKEELEKIRKAIESKVFVWKDNSLKITLTFGLSSSTQNENIDRIIVEADDCLRYGKNNGKNQIVVSEAF